MNRVEKVLALRAQGLNCAQAVAGAFEDKVDYSADELIKMSTGFGAGGGDMQGTCGAIAATQLLMGMILKKKYENINELKSKTSAANREIAKRFREKNKSTICKDLKGIETGKMLRSCNGCVEDATVILDKYLEENGL